MKFFLISLLMFLLIASCSPTTKNQIAIKGLLINSETDKPIKNAKVKISLQQPKESFEISSDEAGVFDFSARDNIFIPELFSDEEDSIMKLRAVKLIFNHPDYVEDEYEEEIEFVPANQHEVDVGAFYLRPRDKVDINGNIVSDLATFDE